MFHVKHLSNVFPLGLLAQLVERCIRIAEAGGSNPPQSTKNKSPRKRGFIFFKRAMSMHCWQL